MANYSAYRGKCPEPFLQESFFSDTGGFVDGRYCEALTSTIDCCLPCAATDWFYPDNFSSLTNAVAWVAVVSFCCSLLLLVSFAVLSVKFTHRHYLQICITIACAVISLGFVVPLATSPSQCYDAITPNDMRSDLTCAWSGSFVIFGGMAGIIWVFLRTLSLHLQICWEKPLGRKFFYSSMAIGWGLPVAGLIIAALLTGWSYRFGPTCHINHHLGLEDFWGPLLGFCLLSAVLAFSTFAYCVKVYLSSLLDNSPTTENSTTLRSYNNSLRTVTARQTYRRVRKVIMLQWRGIAIVLLIIADVTFFSFVFLKMDNTAQNSQDNRDKAYTWLVCLYTTKGDKNECLSYVDGLVVNESTTMAVLVLLASLGIFNLVLVGQVSMIRGWMDLFKEKFGPAHKEFVSVDARHPANDPGSYEMLSSVPVTKAGDRQSDASGTLVPGPEVETKATVTIEPIDETFGKDAKYVSPINSFSTPRPPSQRSRRPSSPAFHYPRSASVSSNGPSSPLGHHQPTRSLSQSHRLSPLTQEPITSSDESTRFSSQYHPNSPPQFHKPLSPPVSRQTSSATRSNAYPLLSRQSSSGHRSNSSLSQPSSLHSVHQTRGSLSNQQRFSPLSQHPNAQAEFMTSSSPSPSPSQHRLQTSLTSAGHDGTASAQPVYNTSLPSGPGAFLFPNTAQFGIVPPSPSVYSESDPQSPKGNSQWTDAYPAGSESQDRNGSVR